MVKVLFFLANHPLIRTVDDFLFTEKNCLQKLAKTACNSYQLFLIHPIVGVIEPLTLEQFVSKLFHWGAHRTPQNVKKWHFPDKHLVNICKIIFEGSKPKIPLWPQNNLLFWKFSNFSKLTYILNPATG